MKSERSGENPDRKFGSAGIAMVELRGSFPEGLLPSLPAADLKRFSFQSSQLQCSVHN